jgi:uncharacterized cupredoxin-like copper-binding protein
MTMQRFLVLAVGLLCALGVAAFAAAQDGTPPAGSSASPAVCASPVSGTPVAAEPAASPAAASDDCAAPVTIELVDIAFKPTDVTVASGSTITLHNTGLALHNFSIESLGISIDVNPGEITTVAIDAAPGDYDFMCDIPGHAQAGMVGILHVE